MKLSEYFRPRNALIIFFVLLALACVGSFTADWVLMQDDRILPNVQVAFVDVGGLKREQAREKLALAVRDLPPAVITDKQQVWLIPAQDLHMKIDLDKSIESAFMLGRNPNLIQRWQERWSLSGETVNLPVSATFDKQKLALFVAPLAAALNRQARNASIQIMPKTKAAALVPAVEGRRLNVEKTVADAVNTPKDHTAMVIELKFDMDKPHIGDAQFAGINTLLASFSTYFKPWDADRNANLRLAADRIHGKRLQPGETFSYNETVGNRTPQQGFRMAPVILNGKLVPDWGGGVCQVSSTLYNAVLLANLDIVERSNHGRAIGYVPLGFDATVVDGQLDFKFKNNLTRPVLIYSSVTEDELYFYVLGDARDMPPPIELDYVVHKVYEPVEIKQPDPSVEAGKEVIEESPQRGFRVSSYRIRTINGKEDRQLLATDDYDPVNRIIKVGSKPVDNQPKPTATAKLPEKPPGQSPAGTGTITLPKPTTPSQNIPPKPSPR